TGPRSGSTTATTTFDLLGMSNTIPSSCGPPRATLTRSPTLVGSIDTAYLPIALLAADPLARRYASETPQRNRYGEDMPEKIVVRRVTIAGHPFELRRSDVVRPMRGV